jgi:hypothetical protein
MIGVNPRTASLFSSAVLIGEGCVRSVSVTIRGNGHDLSIVSIGIASKRHWWEEGRRNRAADTNQDLQEALSIRKSCTPEKFDSSIT